jgi:trigger factor
MNITVEKQSDCSALLRVEIPSEKVTGERRRIVHAFSQQARISGFRPGHAPLQIIEKRYGSEIREELESRLIREALQDAVQQEDLRILDVKAAEETTHHPDGAFSFSSALVLAPQFELPDYKGVELEVPDRAVTDEDVAREIDGLRQRFADFEDITGRAVQDGDFAIIDYTTSLDGQPLAEAFGQSAGYLEGGKDFWLKMEEGSFLPGFVEEVEGASPGDELSFSLTMPDDFPIDGIAGKDVAFEVTVKSVKEQKLPEMTDELAGQVLPGKTAEELRAVVREQLESQLQRELHEFKTNRLIERLNNTVDFEVPDELLTAETQQQADMMVEQGLGSGMSEDEITSHQGELFAAAGQRARLNLKTEFILQEVARAEEISVSDQELAGRVAALAQQAGKPMKTFASELKKSGRLNGLHHSMIMSKTIDFLLDSAKVVEVPADETAGAEEPESDNE